MQWINTMRSTLSTLKGTAALIYQAGFMGNINFSSNTLNLLALRRVWSHQASLLVSRKVYSCPTSNSVHWPKAVFVCWYEVYKRYSCYDDVNTFIFSPFLLRFRFTQNEVISAKAKRWVASFSDSNAQNVNGFSGFQILCNFIQYDREGIWTLWNKKPRNPRSCSITGVFGRPRFST